MITLATGFAAAVLTPGAARAQDAPSPNELAQAREQARVGLAAARDEHWAEARAAFERAYALNPRPLARLNLASAQARTGSYVAAAESYRVFITAAREPDERAYLDDARASLAEAERQVAHVRLEPRGLRDGDALALDGRPVARASADAALPVDPGAHTVAVTRDGAAVARATFAVEPGGERTVPLVVPAPAPLALPAAGTVFASPRPRVVARAPSPWPWVALGAGLLVVAGGVALGVALLGAPAPVRGTPIVGNVGTGTADVP